MKKRKAKELIGGLRLQLQRSQYKRRQLKFYLEQANERAKQHQADACNAEALADHALLFIDKQGWRVTTRDNGEVLFERKELDA